MSAWKKPRKVIHSGGCIKKRLFTIQGSVHRFTSQRKSITMLNKGAKQYNKLLHSDIEGGSVNGNLTPAAMQGGPNGEEMPVSNEFIEGFS